MHEQDGHRSLGASEGKRACSGASVLADAAWAWAGVRRGGSVPPHPSPVAALRCRSNGPELPTSLRESRFLMAYSHPY